MEVTNKIITIDDKLYEAVVCFDKNNLYVLIDNSFISSYYPSTQSYVCCIRQAAREYAKHLEKLKELDKWDGMIK